MTGLVPQMADPLMHALLLHADEHPRRLLRRDQVPHREDDLHPQDFHVLVLRVVAKADVVAADHASECNIVDQKFRRSIRIDIRDHGSAPQRPDDCRAFDSGHREHAFFPPCSSCSVQPQRGHVNNGDISEAVGTLELYALRKLHIQAQVVLGRSAERIFSANASAVSSLQIKTARALGTGSPLNTTVTIFPSSRLTSDELNSRVTMGHRS